MKCPQCASHLNVKDALRLPRLGGRAVALCAFCGGFVALDSGGSAAHMLAACSACGAATDAAGFEQPGRPPRGPGQDAGTVCQSCREADANSSREAARENRDRALKDALRVFPQVARSESAPYFEQVLGALASWAGFERTAFRLVGVQGLGFRSVSLPDGTILAGREILSGLEDEAMLAFLLAREIAHQQSGRVSRRYRPRRGSSALTMGLEWGIGLLTRGAMWVKRDAAELVKEVAWLGYGPAHEQHADGWSIKLLEAAGYDPSAAVRYLGMMERVHLDARGVLANFLDVRPVHSRRRWLAETVLTLDAGRARLVRVNRQAYRRAAAILRREDVSVRETRRASFAQRQT